MAHKLTLAWAQCDPELSAPAGGGERGGSRREKGQLRSHGVKKVRKEAETEVRWKPPSDHGVSKRVWLRPASRILTTNVTCTHVVFCVFFSSRNPRNFLLTVKCPKGACLVNKDNLLCLQHGRYNQDSLLTTGGGPMAFLDNDYSDFLWSLIGSWSHLLSFWNTDSVGFLNPHAHRFDMHSGRKPA